MTSIDVSLIFQVCDEKIFVQRALRSLELASQNAVSEGLTIELMIVFKQSPLNILNQLLTYHSNAYAAIVFRQNSFETSSCARYDNISAARGRYVMICNANDLLPANLIIDMHLCAQSKDRRTIVVPEYYVCFGHTTFVGRYLNLDSITPLVLINYHPYGSLIFGERTIFLDAFYPDQNQCRLNASEDWYFNALAIAKGFDFVASPNTVIFFRESQIILPSELSQRLIDKSPRNPLFQPETYRLICSKYRSWLTDSDQSRVTTFFDRNIIASQASEFFGAARYRQMVLQMNEIDPTVSGQAYRPTQFDFPRTDALLDGLLYLELCDTLGEAHFSDIFLLPSLKMGGSEKYLLQVMDSIAHEAPNNKILVLCHDQSVGSGWNSKVPAGVTVIMLDRLSQGNNIGRNILVVRKFLQSISPGSRVHLKTSDFVFNLFRGGLCNSLAESIVIYYRFCDERMIIDDHVITCANKFDFISDNFDCLNMIVCDHDRLIARDRARIGTEPDKWHHLRAYCMLETDPAITVAARMRSNNRFLWASRLVTQKFPIMLVLLSEILSQRCPSIVIDIYGGANKDPDSVDPAIFEGCRNLNYVGPYDDFQTIDTSRYDGFVYTTMYDGLPNVVLEAMASGLPVIAPECDGLPDVVVNGVTGFLAPYSADVLAIAEAYCGFMDTLSRETTVRLAMSRNCLDLIESRHSKTAHRRRVREIFGIGAPNPQSQAVEEKAPCMT